MKDIHDILKKYWGYTSFRPLQKEIIKAVLQNEDVLVLMPTGGGKSLCFQIPAMAREGLCIVVSPLIALMQDQVTKLKKRGIKAMCVFSGMPKKEIEQIFNNCIYGKVKLLYLAPERLETELFLKYVQQMNISLLVVDEAHCISIWGEDFRPSYKNIGAIKKLLPATNTLALTATATHQVREDIVQQLGYKEPRVFEQSFIRKNLVYGVKKTYDLYHQLFHLLQRIAGSALVYTNTRSKTKIIASYLQKKQIKATYYHAGLEANVRTAHQKLWIENSVRVMVATNAFGMGIDKPDVRMVVHINIPASIEAYYQESGRAGRDGKKSYAILLYNNESVEKLQEHLKRSFLPVKTIKQVYQCLANYYQIAIGSHQMVSYDFDLQDFASVYQISPSIILSAIKELENEEIVQYNDCFFRPAKVNITALPKALYAYQMTHTVHNKLIQTLAYTYGDSLFQEGTLISTKRLATPLGMDAKEVDRQLKELDTLGILHYTPQQNHTKITFIAPRYDQDKLPISIKRIEHKKKQALKKVKSILEYIRHEHRCRTQLLVEYFGQTSYTPCEKCDICLVKKKEPIKMKEALYHYRPRILYQIKKQRNSVYHIVQAINPEKANLISAAIQMMVSTGELLYDKNLRLMLAKR